MQASLQHCFQVNALCAIVTSLEVVILCLQGGAWKCVHVQFEHTLHNTRPIINTTWIYLVRTCVSGGVCPSDLLYSNIGVTQHWLEASLPTCTRMGDKRGITFSKQSVN